VTPDPQTNTGISNFVHRPTAAIPSIRTTNCP